MESEFNGVSSDQPAAEPVDGVTAQGERSSSGPDSWLLASLIIIAAGLLVYANSFSGAFVFDDTERIVRNQSIRSLWPFVQLLDGLGSTRPLVQFTLALNYAFGELDVWGYHAFNISVHLAAALVLFGIVRRTLGQTGLRDRFGGASTPLAFAVALIWTVHPIQTQAVTYVIQRCESMMGLFYLLSLYCAVRAWGSSRPVRWHVAAIISCAVGMMCKEVMVTAPLLILLYDYLFLSGSLREIIRKRKALYAGLASTWLILLSMLFSHSSQGVEEILGSWTISPWRYMLTQSGVILHYIRLSVWPDSLVLDYAWPLVETADQIVTRAILIAALIAATVWAIWHRRASGFPGAWFFLILAPTSSVMPLKDPAFEHRMYLPLASVATLLVIWVYLGGRELVSLSGRYISEMKPRVLARVFGACLLVLVVAVLGSLTFLRNRDYQSEYSIWSDTVRKRPRNARAHANLGVALRRLGRPQEAMQHYELSLNLKPEDPKTHNNMGNVLAELGRFEEAYAHYQTALRLRPEDAETHNNLGAFFLKIRNNPQKAVAHFEKSLSLKPYYPETHNNLGIAYYRLGRFSEAAAHFQQVLRLKPDAAETHNDLGSACYGLGRFDDAVRHYQKALQLKPDFADCHNNLGIAYYRLGRLEEAAWHFREALRLEPGHADAGKNLKHVLERIEN